MEFLGNVILNYLTKLGLKLRILQYISIEDIVPDVKTTFLYLLNTGLIAKLASKQLKFKTESEIMIVKPL